MIERKLISLVGMVIARPGLGTRRVRTGVLECGHYLAGNEMGSVKKVYRCTACEIEEMQGSRRNVTRME